MRRLLMACLILLLGFMFAPIAPSFVCAEEVTEAAEAQMVNINTASIEALATLSGIGEKTAQAIVDYRDENGPFSIIEDIKNVKGIGDIKYNIIKHLITVE